MSRFARTDLMSLVPGRARLRGIALASALGLASGCGAPPRAEPSSGESAVRHRVDGLPEISDADFERLRQGNPPEGERAQRASADDRYAVRVDRTLIYPVAWGRAEDLARTIAPLVDSLYGPGTAVVPHAASNHLLIYLPPVGQRGAAAAPPRAGPPPVPPTVPGRIDAPPRPR